MHDRPQFGRTGGGTPSLASDGVYASATVAPPFSGPAEGIGPDLPIGVAPKASRIRPRSSGSLLSHGGRWTQVTYVLIDAALVSLNATFVFALRFVPGAPLGVIPEGSQSNWQALTG